VQKGQTVYRIATENGITALDLALWNDIPPPYVIHPGQRLRLYPRDGREAGIATTTTGTRAPPASTPRPSSTSAPVPTPSAPTTVASNLGWRWPADGAVVGTFASGDPTRQGIDIAGKSGQPVRAA